MHALRKGAGSRDEATSDGRRGRGTGSSGDSGRGGLSSLPQPPARPRGLEQEESLRIYAGPRITVTYVPGVHDVVINKIKLIFL